MGTVVVPTGPSDCQFRNGVLSGGGGLGGAVSGGFRVITVTNSDKCLKPEVLKTLKELF